MTMAKIVQTVCDVCGQGRNVAVYEFKTPTVRYQLNLCSKHGNEIEATVRKIQPKPAAQRGRPRKIVHKLDATGTPIIE